VLIRVEVGFLQAAVEVIRQAVYLERASNMRKLLYKVNRWFDDLKGIDRFVWRQRFKIFYCNYPLYIFLQA
jgi:hypothetical protein